MRVMTLALLLACTDPKSESGDTGDTGHAGESGESGETGETGETGDSAEDALLARVREALEATLLADLEANEASGASVAVWMDETIVAFGVGTRHPELGGEVTPDTLFQIGSDTKKMTALAVLQQVEAGRVSLDTPLSEALPALSFAKDPSWSEALTVHDLLSHQSGLWDYTPWDHAPEDAELASRATGRFAENEWLMAPPGVFWNYANPGFSLAGLVSEQASGQMWADELALDLWGPLDMSRTFGRLAEVTADGDYATGYGVIVTEGGDSFDPYGVGTDYEIGVLEMESQVDNGFTRPAGLVWSTATDMMKLARFLVDGDEAVLSDALRAELETAQVPLYPTVPGQSYGYGLMVLDGFNVGRKFYETPLWLHGGNTLTMTSTFYVLPEQRFGISILSNSYGDDLSATVAEALRALVALPEAGEAPDYEPVGALEDYVGTWVDPWALGEIVIATDGEDLFISIPALEEAGAEVEPTLDPVIKDLFYATVDGALYDLTFIDGEDGTPKKYLRNRSFVGVRDDGETARPAPPSDPSLVRRRLLEARLENPALAPRALLPGALGAPFRAESP